MEQLPVTRIPLPTPFAVGDVNVYLIRAEPLTIVDAGTATTDAENALRLALASQGVFIEALRRVVVTHAHPDHFGLAPRLREASGAQIFAGEIELPKMRSGAMWWELGRLLLEKAGIPYEVLMEMAQEAPAMRKIHPEITDAIPLAEGDVLEFEGFGLRVHTMPGHTGGHICLHEPRTATLFAGDTLLPTITPNPLMEVDPSTPTGRRRSLVEFMASLERLEAMELRLVYPGHGEPIADAKALIRSYREHHARRGDRIAALLTPGGRTAFQLANEMYPDRDLADRFLAVSEILAHLDVLIEDQRAEAIAADGVVLFRAP
jgi:glyoxylase-like metal-dependent hydrolase (beta-lactamase superfamily II)